MITKYVDMSLSGTSGSGTSGDPFSALAFKSYNENTGNWTDDHTFKFSSRGFVYTPTEYNPFIKGDSGQFNGYAITLESETNEPAVIKCNYLSNPDNGQYVLEMYNAGVVTIRNLIFECVTSNAVNSFTFICVYNDVDSPLLSVRNCSFHLTNQSVTPGLMANTEHYGDLDFVGNTCLYVGNASAFGDCLVRLISQSSNQHSILISSNYMEGKVPTFVEVNSQSWSNVFNGFIRNNFCYNDTEFALFLEISSGTQTGLSAVNNTDNHLISSQFPDYTGSYSGTHSVLIPTVGSALIDAGYAETGWETDLFGQARDASPDVGAVEYIGDQPVTCWNYSARYKGSSRLYRVNGGGKYPSELRVPESVDISTGRMIDEGQLIDSDQFRIIQ